MDKKENKKVTKSGTKKTIKKEILKPLDVLSSKLNKTDFIILGILIVIYSIFAFYHLGSFKNPQTFYHFEKENQSVDIELATQKQFVSKLRYFTGPETGNYMVLVSDDGEKFTDLIEFNSDSTFAWEDVELNKDFKFIELISTTPGSYIGEIQLYDAYGDKILSKVTSQQSSVLLDENSTVPAKISYLNSTYFDEIYYATSAYQYTHGLDAMEWSHPPLGKLIMAIPVLLFGMFPFAYRLMGTIAGILMIPVIYILAKKLFKKTKWAALAGVLMAFDNFHFAQTRMATVDSFLVLFIMLAALFMKNYIDLDKEEKFGKKVKNLLLSGFFIGCSIATKWTGLYAAIGLAIIFFAHLFKQYEDKRKTKINYHTATKIVLGAMVILSLVPIGLYFLMEILTSSSNATTITFIYYAVIAIALILYMIINLIKKDKKLIKLFIICIISFILIPLMIYTLSYVLFPNVANYASSGLLEQTKEMYKYHSTLTETHAFASSWWEWPIMRNPVWLYVGYYGGGVKSTITGIGNPAIWWVGIAATLFMLVKTLKTREKENFFILTFILATYIPYIFIGRAMFMYHFFPTLPFIMLMIVAFIKWLSEKLKTNAIYIFYIALVIIMFLLFYPVSSGMITTEEYIDSLKWFSNWIF